MSLLSTEDLIQLCGDLAITEDEKPFAVISVQMRKQGAEKLKLCLMGRFLANKQVNKEAFRTTIPKIWKSNHGFEVEPLENNTYAFHFKCQADKKRVMAGGPWHFDNHLLILEEPSRYGEMSKMKFDSAEFWVQIHGVPLSCMTKETCIFLGEQVGRMVGLDEGESGIGEGKFVRVRVMLNILKPLKRMLRVDLSGDGEFRIFPLKYERAPDFCYQCGILGHGERECPAEVCSKLNGTKPYGQWLRASSPTKKFNGRSRMEETKFSERNRNRAEVVMVNRTDEATPLQKVVGEGAEDQKKERSEQGSTRRMDVSPNKVTLPKAIRPTNEEDSKRLLESSKEKGSISSDKAEGRPAQIKKVEKVEIEKQNGVIIIPVPNKSDLQSGSGQSSVAEAKKSPKEPNQERKWKRKARTAHMLVDGPRGKKAGDKRGPEVEESLEQNGAKRVKETTLVNLEGDLISAGLGGTEASRTL